MDGALTQNLGGEVGCSMVDCYVILGNFGYLT